MNEAVTVAGYVVVALAMVVCQILSLRTGRIPTLGRAASVLARRRAGRWLLLGTWLWTGWHLFVRSHTGG